MRNYRCIRKREGSEASMFHCLCRQYCWNVVSFLLCLNVVLWTVKKNFLNEKAGHLDNVPSFNLNLSEPWRRISFDMQINRLCKQTITDKGSEGRDGGGEFMKSV